MQLTDITSTECESNFPYLCFDQRMSRKLILIHFLGRWKTQLPLFDRISTVNNKKPKIRSIKIHVYLPQTCLWHPLASLGVGPVAESVIVVSVLKLKSSDVCEIMSSNCWPCQPGQPCVPPEHPQVSGACSMCTLRTIFRQITESRFCQQCRFSFSTVALCVFQGPFIYYPTLSINNNFKY